MVWQRGFAVRVGVGLWLLALPILLPGGLLNATAGWAGTTGLILEPGLPVSDGQWLLPVTAFAEHGVPVSLEASGVRLEIDGEPLQDFALRPFAPEPGGEPCAVAVLVDGRELPAGSLDRLHEFLAAAGGAVRGLYVSGEHLRAVQNLGEEAPSVAEIRRALTADEGTRLWDSVLEAVSLLAEPGLPTRRVLVLLSPGVETLDSRHPLATCVEAARRARVAVYAAILPGDEGGEARLRSLAGGAGGSFRPLAAARDLDRLLALVDGASGLWIESGDRSLPAEVRVTPAQGPTGVGRIEPRRALSGESWLPRLVAGLAVLVVLGGGAWLIWRHRRTHGRLYYRTEAGTRWMSLPRSGLTVGTLADNSLVLSDRRVSKHHVVLSVQGADVVLTDLRSTNGTMVNGEPVRAAVLRDGDRIVLGGALELIYQRHGKGAGR